MTSLPLGATLLESGRCAFRVWAPNASLVAVRFVDATSPGVAEVRSEASGPAARLVPLAPVTGGYHECVCDDVQAGDLYVFRLDDKVERPDPASRSQPHGVHGPSAIVDPYFAWTDASWSGRALHEQVFYEIHVGTFTPAGTFDAAIARLDALVELGITAVQVMPVAQFPGRRNWGYDGVYPFAVQSSYGGLVAFKRFVDACHARGLCVFLDVVYNHIGPEGNYLDAYGPYFTDRYRTPWGRALNFDDAHCNSVRAYVIQNALCWVRDFHVDGLRLDAIHGIFDFGATHILDELQEAVQAFARRAGRHVQVIAESDLNDVRILRPRTECGFELDAQWSDDFHHAVHVLLTGETNGYYADFGTLEHLATALREGFVYSGQYSEFRQRSHGNSARGFAPEKFVICTQNHDQVGNRMLGDRLAAQLGFDAQKLAAALLLLAPQQPMLFMGQEYGDPAPFAYFVSHSDEKLIAAVRHGRKRDFASFAWRGVPPDPQAESTFEHSRLDWSRREHGPHRSLLEFHRELLQLRRHLYDIPELPSRGVAAAATRTAHVATLPEIHTDTESGTLVLRWELQDGEWVALFHLCDAAARARLPLPPGAWSVVLDANESRWGGGGGFPVTPIRSDGTVDLDLPAWSVAVLRRT